MTVVSEHQTHGEPASHRNTAARSQTVNEKLHFKTKTRRSKFIPLDISKKVRVGTNDGATAQNRSRQHVSADGRVIYHYSVVLVVAMVADVMRSLTSAMDRHHSFLLTASDCHRRFRLSGSGGRAAVSKTDTVPA